MAIEFWDNGSTAITVNATEPVYFMAAPEALTAAAPAASVQKFFTELDATSNAVACTLADGLVHGQRKRFVASVVTGGAVTVTIASPVSTSFDVITFTVIGDTADLMWDAEEGYWIVIQLLDTDRDVDTPTIA